MDEGRGDERTDETRGEGDLGPVAVAPGGDQRQTDGSELGKPDSQFTDTTYFFETSEAMPRARAPRNVSGMLEKAPIAAPR